MTWLQRIISFMELLPDTDDSDTTVELYEFFTSISKETGKPVEEKVSGKLSVNGIYVGDVTLHYKIYSGILTKKRTLMIDDHTPAEQFDV